MAPLAHLALLQRRADALPPESSWAEELVPWLGVAAVLLLGACAIALWWLAPRAKELLRLARRLDAVEEIRDQLGRLAGARTDFELTRIEHLLVDIRDNQRRVEDALLRSVESRRPKGEAETPSASMSERVVNRMLSLGFERIELVSPPEEVEAMSDGEVLVEARRGGAMHKGRAIVRDGRIAEVDVKASYSTFP
jgi:hypothetical protein